ncbi:uncharacterized protein [Rutidosis leptorrhynchoides]|uniref:uncharacterized protein n=1 Tax=Rutidosis leptorrhynchoides TaxID=125765 RepID=UPI003A99F074
MNLNDFRPISLISSYYKILTKVLSNRIRKVILGLIDEVQSAFVKGRFILDGALIANEATDYLKKNKRKSLIFKVDFEKAFDSLSWEFLLEIMERMGFGCKWRKWILACLKSASVSVLVNGSPTHEFNLERGIRQGDPLSPFLFIIVAEGLNILTKKAVNCGLFKGVEIGSDKALRVGCKIGELTFTYLGLPIGRNMNRVENWKPVKDKFHSKLADWKAKTISFGGRWAKHWISSRQNLALLGKWFWQAKTEPNSLWVSVIKSIYGTNGLHIPSGPSRPIGKGNVWPNILRAGTAIDKTELQFGTSFIKQIGDGSRTCFWEDTWLIEGTLKDKFKRLYHLESDRAATVCNRVNWIENQCHFSWSWNREVTGRAIDELQSLINILISYVKYDRNSDGWFWKLATNDIFTTKKLSRLIDDATILDGRIRLETLKNNLVPDVWDRIYKWWGLGPVSNLCVNEAFRGKSNRGMTWMGCKIGQALEWTSAYLIWKNLNLKVFSNKSWTGPTALMEIQLKSFEWISARVEGVKIEWTEWLTNPLACAV